MICFFVCKARFCLVGLRLYIPVDSFSVMSGSFSGLNKYYGHNTGPLVRFGPATLRSRVLHSTNSANSATLHSLSLCLHRPVCPKTEGFFTVILTIDSILFLLTLF